jgi:hypothetical protein
MIFDILRQLLGLQDSESPKSVVFCHGFSDYERAESHGHLSIEVDDDLYEQFSTARDILGEDGKWHVESLMQGDLYFEIWDGDHQLASVTAESRLDKIRDALYELANDTLVSLKEHRS